jgi:DNA-binding CsgD family transcriptional regulator
VDKLPKQNIGIYDERTLQRQMLHHNLERMQFEILYSCADPKEFIGNFSIYPVDVILFNAENGMEKSEQMLEHLHGNKKKSSIIFYYGHNDIELAQRFKSKYNTDVFFCKGTWEDIIISLDRLKDIELKCPDAEAAVSLSPDNPFYKIATNKIFIRILQLLREGKNIKQISAITRTPETTVNYYLKKMRNETGCSSIVELVIDAKETGVL